MVFKKYPSLAIKYKILWPFFRDSSKTHIMYGTNIGAVMFAETR